MMALALLLAGCGGAGRSSSSGSSSSSSSSGSSSSGSSSSTPAPAPAAKAQKPVVILQGVDATTLDPGFHAESPAANILNNIYDSLIYRNSEMKFEPGLALSWKTLDDNTWELKLRPNVKFHDGTVFSADDVKATMDRILDPEQKSQRRTNISSVKEVKVIDPLTVQFITSAPYPILLNRLADEHIISAKYLKEKGKEHLAKNPMGTGAYKFVKWVQQEEAVMTANPDYWRGAPKIQQVIFKPVGEAATRIAQLQTGQADLIVNVPANQVEALRNGATTKIAEVPSVRVIYVAAQARKGGIIGNPKFRQAMAHAIDMDSLIKNVLLGNGFNVGTALTPNHFGVDKSITPYKYDPELAKKLLAEAGYKGEEIQFDSPNGRYAMDKEMAEAIAGQLQKVGIKIKFQVNEWGNHVSLMQSREQKGLYLLGWGNSTWDADGTLTALLTEKGAFSTYGNAVSDKAIDEARAVLDPAKRQALYSTALKQIHADAARIANWQQKDVYGVSKRLNWNARSDERLDMHGATVND
jgi:peptide/nickel transport system substrate-binding protein